MNKKRLNNKGFGMVGVLLAVVVLVGIGGVSYYIYHKDHKTIKTTSNSQTSSNKGTSSTVQPPATNTPQKATSFVQTTYDAYLTAINNAGSNNTQPLGLVGLAAVKDDLTADFYSQAAASHNGSAFSCAAQFLPSKYTASLASSNATTATVGVTIENSADSSVTTSGVTVTVDLASLKITAVSCPSN